MLLGFGVANSVDFIHPRGLRRRNERCGLILDRQPGYRESGLDGTRRDSRNRDSPVEIGYSVMRFIMTTLDFVHHGVEQQT